MNWPALIRGMLESSFDNEIYKRPKMELYYDIIREEIATLRGGDASGLSDTHIQRRRSFTSLRNLNVHS